MKFSIALVALIATPAMALQGGYLSQFGGGGKPKPSSLKKKGPVATVGTSYLDNMAGNAAPAAAAASAPPPAAPAAPAVASAPQPATVVAAKVGATPQVTMKNNNNEPILFAINETNEKMNSNYRQRSSLLNEIESEIQMLVARSGDVPAPPAASAPPAAAAPAATSMAPAVAAALAASAPPSAPAGGAAAAANTGSYLERMGGGGSSSAKPSVKAYSYAPTKSNVSKKSGGSGIGSYLDNVGGSTSELTSAMDKANAALQQAGARAN